LIFFVISCFRAWFSGALHRQLLNRTRAVLTKALGVDSEDVEHTPLGIATSMQPRGPLGLFGLSAEERKPTAELLRRLGAL
jgi:hypothetical protein